MDSYPVSNPWCRSGTTRTWRLVGRRSPLRMEAHRHSRSKDLASLYLWGVFTLTQKGHTERPKGVAGLPDVVGTMAPSRVVRMAEFVPYSSSRTNRVSLIAWMS